MNIANLLIKVSKIQDNVEQSQYQNEDEEDLRDIMDEVYMELEDLKQYILGEASNE